MEQKLYTGAKSGLLQVIKRKTKRIFRAKLASAPTPFDWTNDVTMIKNRLAAIGPIKIKNQFQSFSCGGQAGSYWIGIAEALKNGTQYQEVSAKSVYAPIAYPQGGTTDGALQRQISIAGALPEALVPSYKPNGTTDDSWMTDTSWNTAPNQIIASADADWVEVTVDNNIEAIAEAIRDHYAVIWHINGNFYDVTNWLSEMPKPGATNPDGHFMCACDVDYTKTETICALQSWGTSAGVNGIQKFDETTYIGNKNLVDIFTFAPKFVAHPTIPGEMVPNPLLLTWQKRLFNYFLSLFS